MLHYSHVLVAARSGFGRGFDFCLRRQPAPRTSHRYPEADAGHRSDGRCPSGGGAESRILAHAAACSHTKPDLNASTDPDVYTHSSTYPDTYSHTTPDLSTHTDPDVYTHSSAYPDTYSHTTPDLSTHTDPDVYTHSSAYPDTYSHTTPDLSTHTDPDVYAYSFSNSNCDASSPRHRQVADLARDSSR